MRRFAFLLVSLFSFSQAHAYYSNDSYEGLVTFTGVAQIDNQMNDGDTRLYIREQLDYMAGPLQAAAKRAGPKQDEQISILEKYRDAKTGKPMVRYQYTGTMVLEKSLQTSVAIRLPIDFSTIWEKSPDSCFSEVDHRYAYFWNPVNRGCPLVEGVDYLTFQGAITPLPNTTNTMPSYERLLTPNNEIRAVLVFGADQDPNGKIDPDNSKDYNAGEYRSMRRFLSGQGFTRQVVSQQVREAECGKSIAAAPGFVEEYTRQDGGHKVVVRMFWGVVNLGEESSAFYCMLKEGVEKSSVFLYAGHSRIGGLDLGYMSDVIHQPIQVNRDQYQIIGFFGCSSYGYYNQAYFRAKATAADPSGSQNLDVITNGIAGSFGAMADFDAKTLTPILNWSTRGQKASWQQIINSYPASFLTGVNGDQ